jgi:hypothetical protein
VQQHSRSRKRLVSDILYALRIQHEFQIYYRENRRCAVNPYVSIISMEKEKHG